jgi:hypothetical protein
MDMPAPEFDTYETEQTPDCVFSDHLLDALSCTLTTGEDASPEQQADRWEAAQFLLVAMGPRDPVEAALAARAVAAHHASMDMYARAALPGTSNEAAISLRSGAIAASNAFDAALRTLERRQTKSALAPRATASATQGKPVPRPVAATMEAPAASIVARHAEPAPNHRPAPRNSTWEDQPQDATSDPIPPWRHWLGPVAVRCTTYSPSNDAAIWEGSPRVEAPAQTVTVTEPTAIVT